MAQVQEGAQAVSVDDSLIAQMHELESLLSDMDGEKAFLVRTIGGRDVRIKRLIIERYRAVSERMGTVRVLLSVVYNDVMKQYA